MIDYDSAKVIARKFFTGEESYLIPAEWSENYSLFSIDDSNLMIRTEGGSFFFKADDFELHSESIKSDYDSAKGMAELFFSKRFEELPSVPSDWKVYVVGAHSLHAATPSGFFAFYAEDFE